MVYLYATMTASEVILKNDKRLKLEFDNEYLDNKIIVMDEYYYLKYGYEFNRARVIVISENDLSSKYDVECYRNIYAVVNSKVFYNRDLYIVGGIELLKESVPLASEMVFNIVDEYTEHDNNVYFPKYDIRNWKVAKTEVITENIVRFYLHRIHSYGYDMFKNKKVKSKVRR